MQIDLEDLHDTQSSTGIVLDMQDRQRYFEGRSAGTGPAVEVNISYLLSCITLISSLRNSTSVLPYGKQRISYKDGRAD